MFNFDKEDQRILSQIDSKPYRLYTLTDLLPKTTFKLSTNQGLRKQLESRLNHLNNFKIIYKVVIEKITYYFSPKAETEV